MKHASINLYLNHGVSKQHIIDALNVSASDVETVIKKRAKRTRTQRNLKQGGPYIDATVQAAIRLFCSLDRDVDADVCNRLWEMHIHWAIVKLTHIVMITEPYGRTAAAKHGESSVTSTCVNLVWTKLPRFDPTRGTNPFSWLNIVVRNECKRLSAMDRAGMRTNKRMRSAFFRLDDVFDTEAAAPVNKDDIQFLSYSDEDEADTDTRCSGRIDEFVQFLKDRGKSRDAEFVTLSLKLCDGLDIGKRFPSNQLLPLLGERLDLSRQGLYNSRKRLKKLWKEFVDIDNESA